MRRIIFSWCSARSHYTHECWSIDHTCSCIYVDDSWTDSLISCSTASSSCLGWITFGVELAHASCMSLDRYTIPVIVIISTILGPIHEFLVVICSILYIEHITASNSCVGYFFLVLVLAHTTYMSVDRYTRHVYGYISTILGPIHEFLVVACSIFHTEHITASNSCVG